MRRRPAVVRDCHVAQHQPAALRQPMQVRPQPDTMDDRSVRFAAQSEVTLRCNFTKSKQLRTFGALPVDIARMYMGAQ